MAAAFSLFFVLATSMFGGARTAGASERSRWGADYFPNIPLVTQDGETVHFFDDLIKDKVVAINFIYTSCPDSCPLETARLKKVQDLLGDRVGRDVFMYSITIDPETDTPEVLKRYAEKFQVGPGWTFLTGKEEDIELLRKKLGLYITEIQDGSNDHNLNLVIGNQRSGQWMKSSPFSNPYYLADKLGGWLHNWKLADPKAGSYGDAPDLENPGMGENLFRTRCTSCHTIGAGLAAAASRDQPLSPDGQRPLGPDLLDVTERRDRTWLERWLAEPDKMLAEKDPIVMELRTEYNDLPMPNMRLNETEISALLEYLRTESRRVRNVDGVDTLSASSERKTQEPTLTEPSISPASPR